MPTCRHSRAAIPAGSVVPAAWLGGVRAPRPTLPTVVRSLKTMVTRQLGYSIFQASFYDHVVRSEPEFAEIWKYIEENPIKWAEDRYYADAL